jgi:hypothetical protein
MKKANYVHRACCINIRTGMYNYWHDISKCPALTATEKLLVMEMIRRASPLWSGRNKWMGYPRGWSVPMHEIIGGYPDRDYSALKAIKHELPHIVARLRYRS